MSDDDLALGELLGDDAERDADETAATAYVCDVIAGDEVCGEQFDTAGKLNSHRWTRHKIKKDGTVGVEPGRPKGGGRKRTRPTRIPSAPTPAGAVNHAEQYTSGIATLGLFAFMARIIDDYDHAVINAGAPGLGSALDEVAAVHPQVRVACDLILGGGAGGPYVHLVMAAFAVGVPIMAHHNLLPGGVAQRFSEVTGAPAPTVADEAPAPEPTRDPSTWTADEIWDALNNMPPTVAADLSGRMMTAGGPIVAGGGVDMPAGGENNANEHVDERLAAASAP